MTTERVRGLAAAYKLLDGLPAAAELDLGRTLRDIAADVLAAQRQDVAVGSGALRSEGLTISEMLDRMRVRIGVLGPQARKFYYARFVEFGRRAQVVRVIRRKFRKVGKSRRRAAGVAAYYSMRVKAMAPRPFINKERSDLDGVIAQRLADFWSRTLDSLEGA